MITTIVAFLLAFAILVFVHEFGHFIAARLTGVEVKEFFFGFPPRLWSKKVRGVLYGVNAVPIGGYVKLLGEEGEKSQNPRSLTNKSPLQKIFILLGGVMMNFFLAWIILLVFYLFGGQTLLDGMWNHSGVINTQKVNITEVAKDSPAEKSGLKPGDKIISVFGKQVFMTEQVTLAVSQAPTKDGHASIILGVQSGNQIKEKTISTYTDYYQVGSKKIGYERIGVGMELLGNVKSKWYLAPLVALKETIRITGLTFQALGDLFSKLVTQFKLSDNVGGIIAIAEVSGVTAKMGPWAYLQFLAALSVTLAIINTLPIPAVDGGHVFFVVLEWVTKKEVSPKLKAALNNFGFGLVLILAVVFLFKDAFRFGIVDRITDWIR